MVYWDCLENSWPQGHRGSNPLASARQHFLSVAQLGARLFREQEVACSIHARETKIALVAQRKSTSLRSWVVRSSNLFEGARTNADRNVRQFLKLQRAEYGAALFRYLERWPSGLRRLPAKKEPGITGRQGSNPCLSAKMNCPHGEAGVLAGLSRRRPRVQVPLGAPIFYVLSSAGRAAPLQGECRRFDPVRTYHLRKYFLLAVYDFQTASMLDVEVPHLEKTQ